MWRYSYWDWKREITDFKSIPISFFKKYGYLKNWSKSWSLNWSRRWESTWSIGFQAFISDEESFLRVYFTQTDKEWVKKDFDYKIPLVKTLCNYGWFRWWFLCPCKWDRCWVLYLQSNWYFASRKTLNLCYWEQKESKKWRAYWKVLTDNSEKVLEIEKTIKYPYRNWKPTRKMKRVIKLQQNNLTEVEFLQLQKSLLFW